MQQSLEQPESFHCRLCSLLMYKINGKFIFQDTKTCNHEAERRLPENAGKRKEVDEYLESERGR